MGHLGIYLNDHLAGATSGLELARRSAGAQRGSPAGDALHRLAEEIAEDRRALLDLMAALGVPARRYKVYAAWLAEKAARGKPNGSLLHRSPLSGVLELEMLRLGIEGKTSGWRTLRAIADHDDRLDRGRIDDLIARARRQTETVEDLRTEAAAAVFGG